MPYLLRYLEQSGPLLLIMAPRADQQQLVQLACCAVGVHRPIAASVAAAGDCRTVRSVYRHSRPVVLWGAAALHADGDPALAPQHLPRRHERHT